MRKISSHDIAHWASSHSAAAGLLPELVRRLIWSQGASPSFIDFPAGRETQRSGYDGIVVMPDRTNAFIPSGISVWELSVDQKPEAKAQRDYNKRTNETDATPSSAAVYVALTAQRWTGANEWAKERSAEGKWQEVRAYDASTLEQWLEEAPAVSVWLARHMGRPHELLTDALGYLHRWQERVPRQRLPRLMSGEDDPIPPLAYLLFAGRGAEAERVRSWAIEPYAAPLKIHAERRDEAIAFVCAVLAAPFWPLSAATIPRVVVAASADALDTMLESRERDLILLSDFEGHSRPGSRQAHIMEFTDRQEMDAVCLRPQLAHELARVLVERLDMSLDEANRLAQDARGLHALRRTLGLNDRPRWADNSELIPALLLGQWSLAQGHRQLSDPIDSPPSRYLYRDREALVRLSGCTLEVLEQQVLQPHTRGAEPPLEVIRDDAQHLLVWRWRARRDAWTQLSPLISPTTLDAFCQIAEEVFGDDNPLISVDTSDWLAMLSPLPPRFSDELRRSVAEGLAFLATESNEQTRVDKVVRKTLHSAGFERWASLTDELPTLAEAAPTVFLAEVDALLEHADTRQLARLFERYGSSHRGMGLLLGLRRIANAPEYDRARSAAKALCRLQQYFNEQIERWAQPWAQLCEVFHPAWPESALDGVQQAKLLDWLATRDWAEESFWRMRWSWLPATGRMESGRRRSQFRGWGREEEGLAEGFEQRIQEQGRKLLEQVGKDEARLLQIVTHRHTFFSRKLGAQWWEALSRGKEVLRRSTRREQLAWEVQRALGWMARDARRLKNKAARNRAKRVRLPHITTRYPHYKNTSSQYARLTKLYEDILAPDESLKRRWLFERYTINDPLGRPHSLEETNARRDVTLRDLYEAEGIDGWQRLIHEVQGSLDGDFVASHMGRMVNPTQCWEVLERIEPRAGREALFWSVFLYQYARREDVSVEALYEVIDRVDTLPEARRELVRVSAARCLPLEQRTLDYLAEPGRETLREVYWRHREVWLGDDVPAEIALVALREWIERGRWFELVLLMGQRGSWLDRLREHDQAGLVELVQQVLWQIDEMGEDVWADGRMAQVEFIHEMLNKLGGYNEKKMAQFELRRFDKLSDMWTISLFKRLGQEPAFFVEVLSHAYSAEIVEDTPPSVFASNAYHILHSRFAPTLGSLERVAWWAAEVLRLAKEVGRGEIAALKVGEVLARLGGQGDRWPARAVCEVLERGGEYAKQVREGFEIECVNQNGSSVRGAGEGGAQERDLATQYRGYAEAWDSEFDVVPDLLRWVAASFEWWAQREDEEAARAQRRERMYQRVAAQEGLFSIRQAEEEGFAGLIPEWMSLGRLENVQPGVYRITGFDVAALRGEAPIDQVRQSRMALWLWSRQEGVFSHETALSILELSDVNPSKVHITLPLARRGYAKSPDESLVLHFAAVRQSERLWRDEVPITSAARSVNDCAATLQPDLLRQAVTQGLERGLFSREDIAPALEALEQIGVKVVETKSQRRAR